jgi:hypothetical protein
MVPSGMLRRVALVRTDVSEELSASFIRVTRIGELGTTLADSCHPDEGSAKFLRNVGSSRATRHNIAEDAILQVMSSFVQRRTTLASPVRRVTPQGALLMDCTHCLSVIPCLCRCYHLSDVASNP